MYLKIKNVQLDSEHSKSGIINPKKSAQNSLFEETSYRAIRGAQRKKWTLIGVVVFFVCFGIGMIIYHQMKVSKELKLAQEYASIEEIFKQEELINQKKFEELSKTSVKDIQPEFPKSMEAFAQFAKNNQKDPIAWLAAIRSGTYFIQKKDYNKAKEILELIVENAGNHYLVQVKIRTVLAGIYAAEKNEQKAISELMIVEEFSKNPFPNQARLLRAQLLYLSGKKEDAKKLLNQIISTPNEGSSSANLTQTTQIQQQAKVWLSYIES